MGQQISQHIENLAQRFGISLSAVATLAVADGEEMALWLSLIIPSLWLRTRSGP